MVLVKGFHLNGAGFAIWIMRQCRISNAKDQRAYNLIYLQINDLGNKLNEFESW